MGREVLSSVQYPQAPSPHPTQGLQDDVSFPFSLVCPVIVRYSLFNLEMSPLFLSVQLLVFFFLPLSIIITCLNSLSQNVTPTFWDSFELLLYVALSRSFIAICPFFSHNYLVKIPDLEILCFLVLDSLLIFLLLL